MPSLAGYRGSVSQSLPSSPCASGPLRSVQSLVQGLFTERSLDTNSCIYMADSPVADPRPRLLTCVLLPGSCESFRVQWQALKSQLQGLSVFNEKMGQTPYVQCSATPLHRAQIDIPWQKLRFARLLVHPPESQGAEGSGVGCFNV